MPQKCEFRGVILLAHQRIDVDCQAEEQHTIHFVRTDGRTMDGSRVYVTLNMVEELEGEKPSQPGSCRACGRLQAPIAGVGWKCYYEGCLLAGRIVTPQRPEDIPSISNPAKRPTEKPPEPQPPKCCNRHK